MHIGMRKETFPTSCVGRNLIFICREHFSLSVEEGLHLCLDLTAVDVIADKLLIYQPIFQVIVGCRRREAVRYCRYRLSALLLKTGVPLQASHSEGFVIIFPKFFVVGKDYKV